jgi:hypothetical protein
MYVCCTGVPVEAVEPCGSGPQHVAEAGASLVQVHRVHRYIRHVQAI